MRVPILNAQKMNIDERQTLRTHKDIANANAQTFYQEDTMNKKGEKKPVREMKTRELHSKTPS